MQEERERKKAAGEVDEEEVLEDVFVLLDVVLEVVVVDELDLVIWGMHSFFTHPLIPPTFEKWVGTSSFVLQKRHFRPAKFNEIRM